MSTEDIWAKYNNELYFFILKRADDYNATNDIFQEVFLKIHEHLSSLRDEKKLRAWIYQIARNEISNYYLKNSKEHNQFEESNESDISDIHGVCCLDKFIQELPTNYKEVIESIYVEGLKQKDVAHKLGISLENVKIRVKRGKDILKNEFKVCCKYDLNENDKLVGSPNCTTC